MRPDVGNMVTHLTNENPDSKELSNYFFDLSIHKRCNGQIVSSFVTILS